MVVDEKVYPTASGKYAVKTKKVDKHPKPCKPNQWCWGYVLYTSWALVFISSIWDAVLIGNEGNIVSHGEFGFRESIRETRRAKTKATYARTRGPLLFGNIEGYQPLASEGVTHLEDTFGGLISGPANWWKQGEIHVRNHDHVPPPKLVVHNLRESAKHWDNGNSDPCKDRQIYIQGQHIPYVEDDVTNVDEDVTNVDDHNNPDKVDVIRVIVGFVQLKCGESSQKGYLSILQSSYHGGPMVGRIYKIKTNLATDKILSNYANEELKIEMTEIGSFIENRGYGSHSYYIILALLPLCPIAIWYFFVLRLAHVKVVTNVLMLNSASASASSKKSKIASINEESVGESATETSSENGLKATKKESNRTGFINPTVLQTWKLPFFHFFLIFTFIVMNMYQDTTGILVIKEFFGSFHSIKVDFISYAVLLISQELASWIMVIYGKFIDDEQTVIVNKAMIYAYQYAKGPLFALKCLNLSACAAMVLLSIQIIDVPIQTGRLILYGLAFMIFVCDLTVINYGLVNHPFLNIDACMIGGISGSILQTARGISNFLVSRKVKGASASGVKVNGCPGMEFNGILSDAIMLARPDYLMEGFINGENIQLQLLEKTGAEMSMDFTRFKPVGDHQFEVTRHWLFQGKTGIMLY